MFHLKNFRFPGFLALCLLSADFGIAQTVVTDRFEGSTLNPQWVTTFTTKGGGSYRQTNGALQFTVATGSTNRVENNIHVLNTNALPTDRSWTLVIGMHNSANYSSNYGSSQLQLGIFDARTVSPSNTLGVGLTLARYYLKNNGNPLFGFGGSNLPKWHAEDGIWTNASSNGSAKFIYHAPTRTLQGFVTTEGTNPVDEEYDYIPTGPASSVPIPPSAKLNFYVIQNVYSVAVPVGKMWVDNFQLTLAARRPALSRPAGHALPSARSGSLSIRIAPGQRHLHL